MKKRNLGKKSSSLDGTAKKTYTHLPGQKNEKKNQTDLRRETHPSWEQKNGKKKPPWTGKRKKNWTERERKKLDREKKTSLSRETPPAGQSRVMSDRNTSCEPQRARVNRTEKKRNLLVHKLSGREKTGHREKKTSMSRSLGEQQRKKKKKEEKEIRREMRR
jgi:hypothetical protein